MITRADDHKGLSLSRTCKLMLATIGVALYNRPIMTKHIDLNNGTCHQTGNM